MTKAPKISIVTPSFNQAEYIEATIQSILNQNYPNLEYIIIDGGSTDNSVTIIKRYEKSLRYWISEPDNGQGDAINKGFRKSTGEIMTWLNSDDTLLPGTLQLIANIFSQLPDIEWVSGIPTTINKEGFIMHVGLKPVYIREFIKYGFHHGRLLGFIMQEGTFWRRSLWEKAGGKVDSVYYSLDFRLWKRFAQHSDLVPISTSLAAYRLNPYAKNATVTGAQKHYYEIGVHFPAIARLLALPVRMGLSYGCRKLNLSAEIFYDTKKNNWKFRPGILSAKLRSLKPSVVHNKKLV